MEILNNHLTGETSFFDLEYRLVEDRYKSHWVRTCGVAVARSSSGRPTRVIMISQKVTTCDGQNTGPA